MVTYCNYTRKLKEQYIKKYIIRQYVRKSSSKKKKQVTYVWMIHQSLFETP